MAVDEWKEYLEAAQRKMRVADFHLARLSAVVTTHMDREPPIELQAHFEGVVVSVIAAVDQVGQAVNSALRLGASPGDLFEKAFGRLRTHLPAVDAWCQEPIGRDLRSIRVRIIHYAYSKTAHELGWTVEPGRGDYQGSREVVAYASAAVDYSRRLVGLIPSIEELLGAGGANA